MTHQQMSLSTLMLLLLLPTSMVHAQNTISLKAGEKISKQTISRVMQAFEHEPSIKEVQEKAVAYAGSEGSTKSAMLFRARSSGLLPRVTVSPRGTFDRDTSRKVDPDANEASAETYNDGNQASLSVAMRWDLNHLIYHKNEHQIQKVGIQIGKYRERIINQVTRRYFERRKLQIELELDPPKKLSKRLDKELRLQELTANIDALTGNWFSQELKKSVQ